LRFQLGPDGSIRSALLLRVIQLNSQDVHLFSGLATVGLSLSQLCHLYGLRYVIQ